MAGSKGLKIGPVGKWSSSLIEAMGWVPTAVPPEESTSALQTGVQDGTGIYLIGTFITYESAAEYADLLVRNGYRESKVTAWLGKKEIPVESARELFQKL